MKVVCERCGARLELDRSRLGATGAQVRCPHCKHAFFVTRPGQGRDALLEEAALDAARRGEPLPPSVVEDLPPESGARGAEPSSVPAEGERAADAASPAGEESENESDWEFDADFPIGEEESGGEASGEPETAGEDDPLESLLGGDEPPASAGPAEASELEELGEPETWDLLSPLSQHPPQTGSHAPRPPRETGEAGSSEAEPGTAAARAGRESESAPAELTEPVQPARRVPAAPALAMRAGWAASAVLAGLGLALSLLPLPVPAPVLTGSRAVAGLQVIGLRGTLFTDSEAGPLYVVQGELINPGQQPRRVGAPLRLELFSESVAGGRKLEAAVGWALPSSEPVPWELLRDPEARARELAQLELAPGEGIPFAAVVRGEVAPPLYARIEPESAASGERMASDERLPREAEDAASRTAGTPPGTGDRADSAAAPASPLAPAGPFPPASERAR